jgi:hypothetical protein
MSRNPPLFLKPGDFVEYESPVLGSARQRIAERGLTTRG